MSMITDVYIVLENLNDKDRILAEEFGSSPFFYFMDAKSKLDKSKARKFKEDFGARLNPFAAVFNKDHAKKAFYSEASNDVIGDLIKYLHNYVNEPEIIQL